MNSPCLGVLCRGESMGLSQSFQISHFNQTLTGKNLSFVFQCIVYTPVLLWVGSLRWGYGRSSEFGLVLYPLCRGQPSLGNAVLPQNCPWYRDAELVLALPTWKILTTLTKISFTKCSRFTQTSEKLDPFWTCIDAEKHSFFQYFTAPWHYPYRFFFQSCFFFL